MQTCGHSLYICKDVTEFTFVSLYDQTNWWHLHSQLNSYLLSMSYSDCEVWAGANSGKVHSFSMQGGTLKPLSQFDVGHTTLITGIHRSPGSLYTCSSDRTVKVARGTFLVTQQAPLQNFFQLVVIHCVAGTHSVWTSKDIMHPETSIRSRWG